MHSTQYDALARAALALSVEAYVSEHCDMPEAELTGNTRYLRVKITACEHAVVALAEKIIHHRTRDGQVRAANKWRKEWAARIKRMKGN